MTSAGQTRVRGLMTVHGETPDIETSARQMNGDRFRVGLLGAGYIADWHAQALKSVPNASLIAVCDTNLGRARSLAERYQVQRVHASLDEMLEIGNLDAVHVLLPAERHHAAAIRVLGGGLHALLEKPMSATVE